MKLFDNIFKKSLNKANPDIEAELIMDNKPDDFDNTFSQNVEFFETSIRAARKMLATKDYDGLNKYLRMLTLRENLEVVHTNLSNPGEKNTQINSFFGLFDEIVHSLSLEGIDVEIKEYAFNIHKDDEAIYQRVGYIVSADQKPTFSIKERPILLNCWNKDRVATNISSIGKNNILDARNDILNTYLYPLDLVTCSGGNHRQLSAILDNATGHTSVIEQLTDVRPLYPIVRFDGNNFVTKNGDIIYSVSNSVELLIGTFYEIGRILLKEPGYYPKFVSTYIK